MKSKIQPEKKQNFLLSQEVLKEELLRFLQFFLQENWKKEKIERLKKEKEKNHQAKLKDRAIFWKKEKN